MQTNLLRIFGNPAVKDAENIQQIIDYRILVCIWHEYSRIQSTPPNQSTHNSRRATTPVWTALSLLRNFHGNFDKFAKEDLYYLKALYHCVNIYDEVVDTLSAHDYTQKEAIRLFDTHPDLCDAIPEVFEEHRNKTVITILLQVVIQYRDLLKEFIECYGDRICLSIEKYDIADSEEYIEEQE